MKASSLKTYGKGQTKLSSRNSSLTIVATDGSPRSGKSKVSSLGKRSLKRNVVRSVRPAKGGPRATSEGTIRVISVASVARQE